MIVKLITKNFEDVIGGNNEEITLLKSKVCILENKVECLADIADSCEAYKRRNTFVMSGEIPEVAMNENLPKIVIDHLHNQIGLKLADSDIDSAYRAGKKTADSETDRRKIVFKLSKPDLKNSLFSACLSHKPSFFINEQLTTVRGRIMFELRQLKRKFPAKIMFCRATGGDVSVYIPDQSGRNDGSRKTRRMVINTRRQLETFTEHHIGLPSTECVRDWPELPGYAVSS